MTFLEKIQLKETDFIVPEEFKEESLEYKKIMATYYAAIKMINTKLGIISDQLQVEGKRNPIEFVKARLKQPESIMNKLVRFGLENTLQSLVKIPDIAGVRIVVTYIDDLYEVANMLAKQDDIKLLKIKNYVKNPKDNGYRSLHLLVEVPVFFADEKKHVQVEVQVRTLAMDLWATLEHDIEYKNNLDFQILKEELKQCADIIFDVEERMQNIKTKMTEMSDKDVQTPNN